MKQLCLFTIGKLISLFIVKLVMKIAARSWKRKFDRKQEHAGDKISENAFCNNIILLIRNP